MEQGAGDKKTLLYAPCSLLCAPYSLLPALRSLLPAPCSALPALRSMLPAESQIRYQSFHPGHIDLIDVVGLSKSAFPFSRLLC